MNKRPLRVLLVEDDEDDFLLTRDLLGEITTYDCEIVWAANYPAAKKAVTEKTFDVCLVDYRLGEHTGLELLRETATQVSRPPMILLTGQDDHAIDLEAMQAGAADYLIKGKIEAALLERAIRYALERKRIEDALEEAAKRQRAVIDNALDVICTIDAKGLFVTINPACFKMWGYQPEELIGRQFIDLVAPEDVAKTSAVAANIIAGKEIANFENCFRHKNGTLVNLTWTAHWSENERLMFAVAHDITERKQVEETLEKERMFLDAVLASMSDGLVACNAEGELTLFNRATQEFHGLPAEPLAPEQWAEYYDLYQPDGKTPLEKNQIPLFRALQTGTVANAEMVIAPKNKEPRTLIASGQAIFDAHGRKIGAVVGMHDITERKQAEKELRESQQLLKLVIDTLPLAVWWKDRDSVYLGANRYIANAARLDSPEQMVGLTDYDLPLIKNDAASFRESDRRVMESGIPELNVVKPVLRSSGKQAWINTNKVPLRNIDGEIVGIIGTFADITEQRRTEEAVKNSRDYLHQIINTVADPIFVSNRQHRMVLVNDAFCQIMGRTREEIIGTSPEDMCQPEEARIFIEMDNLVFESGKESSNEEQLTDKNGNRHIVMTKKTVYENQAGEQFIVGVMRDITESKKTEQTLRENEAKFRDLFDNAPVAYHELDTEGCFTRINHTEELLLGYTNEELKGRHCSEIIVEPISREATTAKLAGTMQLQAVERTFIRKDGSLIWVLNEDRLIYDATGKIEGIRSTLQDITERKRIEERLLHDAFHDGLTDLANRKFFTEHLQMTIERLKRDRSEMFAVLFLDFDRFKVINDSLGHAEGDNLLKQIARRLESSLRSGDLVARLGGDEFTILVNNIKDSSVALRVAERIQSKLQTPFEIGGGEIFISASIGIALSTTGHDKAEDMLRDADIAMYRAKAKGKAQHQVFDRQMHEHALKQLRLETEMRQALEREEFLLHYQPIFSLDTESLIGFESLVRWKHPELGMISPFEFVPAAEENGLILPLGSWILYESCRQLRSWQEKNPAASDLTMSVNLSSKQFLQADLSKQVANTLEKTGLDPRFLKLEITESHIMENSDMAVKTMSNLRSLGVELSLDDFGTGYSSLSYLHRLPVNYLKIDRSFVSRMIESEENSEIINTIIRLAQNLKMKVVAEGIETAEQLAQLKMLNCEYGQGYFFAKPLEAEAAERFINKSLENPT